MSSFCGTMILVYFFTIENAGTEIILLYFFFRFYIIYL